MLDSEDMRPTNEIEDEFNTELAEYLASPTDACTKAQALRSLKKFNGKLLSEFLNESAKEYFPAVSAGIMKIDAKTLSHDKALVYARNLILDFDVNELARAYLYGVAHNSPEYCTALAAYYYIKNLPEHGFEPSYIGFDGKHHYDFRFCEICSHRISAEESPKRRFWYINTAMARFYLYGKVPFSFDLNTAVICLEEYKTLDKPSSSPSDLEFFMEVMKFIEAQPPETGHGKLRDSLKKSNILKMTKDQLDAFIDMLGYLNILHPEDCFGVTECHTCKKDMKDALSFKSYAAYPVNRWIGSCGVDYRSIDKLFGKCY